MLVEAPAAKLLFLIEEKLTAVAHPTNTKNVMPAGVTRNSGRGQHLTFRESGGNKSPPVCFCALSISLVPMNSARTARRFSLRSK